MVFEVIEKERGPQQRPQQKDMGRDVEAIE